MNVCKIKEGERERERERENYFTSRVHLACMLPYMCV